MEYSNADNKNERYFEDENLKQSVYPSDNQLVEDYREQETILRNQVKALEEQIQQYHNDEDLRKRNTEDKASYLEKKLKHQMSQNESIINALNSKNDCVNNLQNQLAEQTSRAKMLADKLEEYSNLNKKLGGDFALFSDSVSKIKVDMKQHYEKITSQYEMTIVKLQNEKSELNAKVDTLIKNCDESYKENAVCVLLVPLHCSS